MHGPAAEWGNVEHLLAAAVDALAAANWQRSGGKGPRPKPIVRPGDESKNTRRFGTAKMGLDEAAEFFKRLNRQPPADPVSSPQTAGCVVDGCGRGDVHARGMCPKHYQRWRRSSRA